eukprot:3328852-Pyramimonas_sp.AAC.1
MKITCGAPRAISRPVVLLAPKPEPLAKRPLGHFIGFVRVVGKIQKQEARQWELEQGMHGSFSMAPMRSPADTVWRRRVLAEQAGHAGESSLQIPWDIKQFYEHVDYDLLIRAGQFCEYPARLLMFAISTCQWPRFMLLGGVMDQACYPRR